MTDTITVSLRQMILTLACLPAGAHSADPLLTKWSRARVGNEGNKLVALGKLFKAQLGPRETRFFATPALRDAFIATHTPKTKSYGRYGLKWQATGKAPWPAGAPAIVPPGLVIQRCPSHAPRFSEHRFAFVHG